MFSAVNKFDMSFTDEEELSHTKKESRGDGILQKGIVVSKHRDLMVCIRTLLRCSIIQELELKWTQITVAGEVGEVRSLKDMRTVCAHFICVGVQDQGRHRVILG